MHCLDCDAPLGEDECGGLGLYLRDGDGPFCDDCYGGYEEDDFLTEPPENEGDES